MHQDVSAVILAGGDSKRMGQDKNLIRINGVTLIEIVVEKATHWFDEVVVVVNDLEKYDFLNQNSTRIIKDKISTNQKCSLRGIYAGLDEITKEHGFVLASDMPFISGELVAAIVNQVDASQWDVIIPRCNEHYEPLFAIYHKFCLPLMKAQLLDGNYKILNIFEHVEVLALSQAFCQRYDPELWSFFNVNTPEQLHLARQYYQNN